ncbi:MAG: N-acetylmuramoyl-L-alanine amidase [Verrucomicrobiales bacterium]
MREKIDAALVGGRRWREILIVGSECSAGNAKSLNSYHLKAHDDDGLKWHFVVGNGSLSRNGEIEVGPRWDRQVPAGSGSVDSLEIALIGELSDGWPTQKQADAVAELVDYLQAKVGVVPVRVAASTGSTLLRRPR